MAVPSATLGARTGLNPLRHASQTPRGASSNPWPASLSVHQSRARVVAGSANRNPAARVAAMIGTAQRGVQLANQLGDWGRAVTRGLPASPAKQHDGDGLEHDHEVLQ